MVSDLGTVEVNRWATLSLNPCSNGIWSLTEKGEIRDEEIFVLILVLMEYGL